jgi:hypothetical protein
MIAKAEILDKARKLKALTSSPNEHESALAMKMMQAILIKHGLSEKDLEKDEFGNVIFLTYDEVWVRGVAAAISKLYFCRVVRRGTATSKQEYLIIGRPENAEVVREILSTVIDSTNKAAKNSNYDRRSFCRGVASKIFTRCEDLIESAKRGELTDEVGEALVIGDMYAKVLESVDEYINKTMNTTPGKSRKEKPIDRASYGAGAFHGETVDLQKKLRK